MSKSANANPVVRPVPGQRKTCGRRGRRLLLPGPGPPPKFISWFFLQGTSPLALTPCLEHVVWTLNRLTGQGMVCLAAVGFLTE